jgi:hypothetical protein
VLQRPPLSSRSQQSRPASSQVPWERSWARASGWVGGGGACLTPKSDAHINTPPSNPRTCCYGLSCPKGASRAAQHRSRRAGRGAGVRQVGGLGEPTPHPQSLTPTSTPPLYQPQNLLQRTLLSQRSQQSRPAPSQLPWERSWARVSGWLLGPTRPLRTSVSAQVRISVFMGVTCHAAYCMVAGWVFESAKEQTRGYWFDWA